MIPSLQHFLIIIPAIKKKSGQEKKATKSRRDPEEEFATKTTDGANDSALSFARRSRQFFENHDQQQSFTQDTVNDTTLESLEGRHNGSITPPPDIVKKRQQQAANQAGNQRVHHKPSSNIEHVRYNEDERKQRQAQFGSRPQERDRQPSGEYRVRSESRERSPRGQRSRYYNQDLGGQYRNEERHDTRPSYAEHPHPYPHPHRSDRAPSDDSRRSRNSSRDDDFRRLRYVQSDRSRRSPSP